MSFEIVNHEPYWKPTHDDLVALLVDWQRRLRLQDWDVKIQLRRRHDMSMDESQGVCRWQLQKRYAMIEIVDPIDFDEGTWHWKQDIERTIVHELLHLHFAPFDSPEPRADVQQEQAINAIAQALVDAKREGRQTAVTPEREPCRRWRPSNFENFTADYTPTAGVGDGSRAVANGRRDVP